MRHLANLEETPDEVYEILDPTTGRLKDTGYFLREANLVFNRDAVKNSSDENPIRTAYKMRHGYDIVTFAPQQMLLDRIYDFGVNVQVVSFHFYHENPKMGSNYGRRGDHRLYELTASVDIDRQKIGVQTFNLTSWQMEMSLNDKPVDPEGPLQRELHFRLRNPPGPWDYEYDIDIKIDKADEAVTLLQDQTPDGQHFMAYSSIIALESEGHHVYKAWEAHWDEHVKSMTNIISYGGVPLLGQGSIIRMIVNGRLGTSEPVRFGFQFLGGTSGFAGASTASANYFSINGKVHKLGSMDLVGFRPGHKSHNPILLARMRDAHDYFQLRFITIQTCMATKDSEIEYEFCKEN